jgi:pimeloyl-[acyl-carrier protein] synthase
MPDIVPLDLRDPAFRADPHSAFARLREHDPVHRDAFGMWLITRHDDVVSLNRDPRLGRDLRKWIGYPMMRPYLADTPLERCVEAWMFSIDPPEHTRLRKLVKSAFHPKNIELMSTAIEAVADELLDNLPRSGELDLMAAYASQLPLRVIGRILSLPPEDDQQLMAWSNAVSLVIEPTARRRDKAASNVAVQELSAYLERHVAAHEPRDEGDLLGDLIRAEEEGDRLGGDEFIANLVLLLVAGHETTTNLIGNGMLALLRHPEELARLRQSPELIDSAVEEMLRYEGPANTNGRVTHEDIEVRGVRIEAGQLLLCMLGAANRDPEVFVRPNELDITRDPNPHVTFGGGVHFCVGASLARLETRIAFSKLLERFQDIALVDENPPWRNLINMRGLSQLQLRTKR